MANNYTQFSEVIPRLTPEEERWLNRELEVVFVLNGQEYGEDELLAGAIPDENEFRGCRAFRDMPDYDSSGDDEAGFSYRFDTDDEGPSGWGRHFWIYADESGDLERIGHLVQKFLKTFRPNECWVLTYSESCSRPCVGEFGGGALFVTAQEIKWQSAYSFIAAERAAFEKRPVERAA
jgi:hypothetical protein